jgi:hypothetical protein
MYLHSYVVQLFHDAYVYMYVCTHILFCLMFVSDTSVHKYEYILHSKYFPT